MTKFITIATITAALAFPAFAQDGQTEIRGGERYLVPKDESTQDALANMIQTRAIEMGFFHWPMPTEKAVADQVNRPRQVSDCNGHDSEYRPAHDYSAKDDQRTRKIGQAKAFIYEWMAYGNAIEARDCTCASLNADWGQAVSSFQKITDGVDNHLLYTAVPSRMRNGIKRDYGQMCDARMSLDLG